MIAAQAKASTFFGEKTLQIFSNEYEGRSMTPAQLDNQCNVLAEILHENHMSRLGIEPTMKLASAYNHCRYAQEERWRNELYSNKLDDLLKQNGELTRSPLELRDGWALDTSMTLPFLQEMLEESDKIIQKRQGVRSSSQGAYRSFFQNVFTLEDAESYPSFLNFATSSDLIVTVASYLQTIPALSTTLPPGIRLVESNVAFDDQPEQPKDSQLFHIDYYSLPNVYVLVLLRDTTLEHGPWSFIPREKSEKVKQKLGYWKKERGYRITDKDVYSVVDPEDVIEFTYPRGTVLFIESSGCLHYGSRNSVKPRWQLMLGYTGACRSDFSEIVLPKKTFATHDNDSSLRRMVIDKYLTPPGYQNIVDPGDLEELQNQLPPEVKNLSENQLQLKGK